MQQQSYETLKHTTWECKYHVVFIPKYRRKTLYAQMRRDLGPVVPILGRTEGMQSGGGALDAGPSAYASVGAAQVCGVAGDGFHQREECNPRGTGMPDEKETSSAGTFGRVDIGCRR